MLIRSRSRTGDSSSLEDRYRHDIDISYTSAYRPDNDMTYIHSERSH